jgi:hypothetical protein
MSRFLSVILLLAALCGPLAAQDVPLQIVGGNVQVVKIDKVVIVKTDLTVVQTFPFSVKAGGEGFFFWTVPQAVTFADKGDVLEITSAPKGNLTIRVKVFSAEVDGGKIKYVTRVGSITFAVAALNQSRCRPSQSPIPQAQCPARSG